MSDSRRRLLLVHAHPDDETIGNGATMALYAAQGAAVTLVTCTLGEEGEILVPELASLASDQSDRLGEHRAGELAAAMDALGVTDYRLLGGPGRYRDSGMVGTAPNDRSECFYRADLRDAASHIVEIIREVRPHVLVTYDDFGGYGHPDHVQAHRVATYGAVLAAIHTYRPDLGPAWDVPKIYWNATPRSWLAEAVEAVREAGSSFFGATTVDDLPFAVPDEWVSTEIDGSGYAERKIAALRAYATQLTISESAFALSNGVEFPIWSREAYRLVKGTAGPRDGVSGLERDLFDGLDHADHL